MSDPVRIPAGTLQPKRYFAVRKQPDGLLSFSGSRGTGPAGVRFVLDMKKAESAEQIPRCVWSIRGSNP